MTFLERTLRWQQWLTAGAFGGMALVTWPFGVEPFMLPKATFLLIAATGLVAIALARALWSRQVQIPLGATATAVAAFASALVLATVTSDSPWTSLIGVYTRYSGLLPYLAYLVLFLTVLRTTDSPQQRLLVRTALVASALVVAYGFIQAAGWDPAEYPETDLGTTFSFFGNVNFSAAWVGAVSPLCLQVLLAPDEKRAWRVFAGVLLPLGLLYTIVTGSVQGPAVALVGLFWCGVVNAASPDARLRSWLTHHARQAAAGAGAFGLSIGLLGWMALPRLRAELDASLVERRQFWSAAVDMMQERPLIGTGLDTFAHNFLAFRPPGHALTNGLAGADAPHSVPLSMFTGGGAVLGLAYLAVVALVAFVLLSQVWATRGTDRAALAGFGGVWLAYQAQSLVSLDVPPLAVLHWVSSGVIVAVATPPRFRLVRLPGHAAATARSSGRARGRRPVSAGTRVGLLLLIAVALTVMWSATRPLRADMRAASAEPLTASGRYAAAAAAFQHAARLNPAEGSYSFLAARSYSALGRTEDALEAAAQAARRGPGVVDYVLFAAQESVKAGNADSARRWYRRAAEVDPVDPPVLVEVGNFLLRNGQADEAASVLVRAKLDREDATTLLLLGEARLAQGDVTGARAAAERALVLEPANAAAADLLARVARG